ncbi:EFR1 family ferrodoxin [Methanomicrobium antiquum]|uniref:EFR1 family ferrodoxin n=1 Tax=Methanomicrobium antiquum TaxID=487686 RepID=A0AAF0JUI2_9EURY|nr:EFR1 family ferrodoxin [Methanomicrobium antiquum]WFN37873.1 EFR1 family ferrodoxin [Methanomicrobium antiquum]
MKTESVNLVYFSPTGTTKAVISAIARGINPERMTITDITKPDERKKPLELKNDHLLIIGVPVYMGRVPALLSEWLGIIKGNNTPVVCVVVYGNRVYEDALLELSDILTERGFITVAGAAFIGEHSFSTKSTPIAKDRPDKDDISKAEFFGKKIQEKLKAISSPEKNSNLIIPGTHPYRGDSKLWITDFIEVSDACIQCGVCADVCPCGAVSPDKSSSVDIEKCITCCACIKKCPEHARSIKPGMVSDASNRLFTLYSQRKEPEYFL